VVRVVWDLWMSCRLSQPIRLGLAHASRNNIFFFVMRMFSFVHRFVCGHKNQRQNYGVEMHDDFFHTVFCDECGLGTWFSERNSETGSNVDDLRVSPPIHKDSPTLPIPRPDFRTLWNVRVES
jgi:hypothetical protein